MTKRQIFYFSFVMAIILIATGIPLKSNPDPDDLFAGTNVNMGSSKEWPDPEGDVYLQRQNEPSLAVSTLNPLHLLAASNDYRSVDTWESQGNLPGIPEEAAAGDAWLGVFKSYDGGQSWKSRLLPGYITDPQPEEGDSLKTYDAASDPTVRAGVDGLFFISGIAFDRDRNGPSVIFVCRFKDYNDTESGDSIRYIDTTIVDEGTSGQFADKPWLAVDVPRPGYPDGIFYLVYSTFLGDITKTTHNKLMLTRSIDGGETWEAPIKLSESHRINQGTTVATDPQNGDVYIAWRRWAAGNDPDAIMVAKSTDYGQTFTKAEEAAIIPYTFDQPTVDLDIPSVQFRTNAFPTMAIDNNHRVYIAWVQRESLDGPARIFFTSALNGIGWPLTQTRIHNIGTSPDDYNAEGHMFMPSMTFAAGKLLIAWYDSRESVRLKKGGTTQKWLTDYYLGEDGCPEPDGVTDHPCYWRETIDVRIAQADPNPVSFEPSTQVSRYIWFFKVDENGVPIKDENDNLIPIQVQFNAPNYPLFKGGTVPFIGDYIDLVPAPMFINDGGTWRYNTGQTPFDPNLPPDPFVFYVSWTDNRDVRPPADDLYDLYNPWELYGPPDHNNCLSGFNAGMRNQNVYVSRITSGISVGCPGNYKPSGPEQKTFVINVENMTSSPKSFNMSILNPPPSETASFSPSGDLLTLTIDVDEYSSISRHVFVQSDSPHTTIVQISESGVGDFIGYVNLYLVAEGGSEEESIALDIIDGGIVNWSDTPGILPMPNADIFNATMFNATMFNATMFNATMFNATMFNATMFNATMFNATMFNASIINPTEYNATMFNGNIANPFMSNSTFDSSINGAEVVDKFWQVTNTGDTSSSYTLKTIAGDGLPQDYYSQLLVYKVHRAPATGAPGTEGECTLLFDDSHELLLNIDNPNVTPDISEYSKIVDPDLANVHFTNATFSLAPEEEAIVILRVIDTTNIFPAPSTGGFVGFGNLGSFPGLGSFGGLSGTSNGTQTESDPEEIADNVGAVVISHSSTDGTLVAITLQILPDSLDDGKAGVAYGGETLRVIGGTGPYSWSLYDGSLPAGMTLSSGGVISGTPKEAEDFNFTVQVTDGTGETDTQKFTIFIHDPDPITIFMDPVPAPDGVKYSTYSPNVSFTASGGVLPYSWIMSGAPQGLSLDLITSDITGETMELTGAPQQAGDFGITVTVTDDFYPEGQVEFVSFNLCVMPLDLVISTMPSPLPEGYLGSYYDATLTVSNTEEGLTPSWKVTGLPDGLDLSSPTGASVMIIGLPTYDPNVTYPETYDIKVKVTDGFTSSCYTRGWIEFPFTITIHPKEPAWSLEGVDGEAIAAATDSEGNVYVTGFTHGEETEKDYYTVKYDTDGTLVWYVPYNGPGNGDDVPSAIAVHDSGVYVTGTSYGYPTGDDFYTVKYDRSSGDVIWEDRFDGPSYLGDGGNDLALDIAGNAQVAGYVHRGNVTKHADYTTLKYSSSGGLIWDEGYDSQKNGNDIATAIAVDSLGHVYVTGKSQESLPKGPTTHDYLTMKYDSSGKLQWTARDDGPHFGDDEPTAIALHEISPAEIYVYVTGYTSGGAYGTGYYTVKYDATNGNTKWGEVYDSPVNGDDVATSIAVDSSGIIYVTGKSSGTKGLDYATIKYSSSGTPLWEKRHDGGIGNDEAVSIAVDGLDIYVAGFITTEEDGFAADKDIFLIKYNTSGDIIWIAQYDGLSGMDDVANDMALSGTGIFVVGYSQKDATRTVFAVVKYEK